MSFPLTVDAALSSAEQPSKYGPFVVGTARYEILVLITDLGVTLVAKKSTDGGVTWSVVDGAGAPIPQGSTPIAYCCCQAGAILYVVYTDQNLGQLALVTIDTGTDLWGTPAPVALPPGGGFVDSGEGGNFLYQACLEYSPFDNTLLLVMASDRVTLNDVGHVICVFSRYDIGGAIWSSWTDLGYVDYSTITTWDQVPCGLAVDTLTGRAVVLMQQVARAGPGNKITIQITTPGPFAISLPLDTPTMGDALLWGSGGGGGPGDDVGSAGGGGAFKAGPVTLVAGGTLTGTVGAGGASGADGNPTTCQTLTADPGLAGSAGASTPGGAGGAGDHDGGKGGASNVATGGGGGGSALATADGDDGHDGGASLGGAGGSGQGSGGAGGNSSVFNPPTGGEPGANPGGGGGGHGVADFMTPGGNNGGDGEFDVSWIAVRNTNGCRTFQQLINPNNSIGTLTEIPEGRYPSRDRNAQPIPITFDAATFGGKVFIAFTGATSTSDKDNIAVGVGTFADPVAFSFTFVSCGNGGNGVDSSPALAAASAGTYLAYISAPNGQPVAFLSRLNTGSGFGSPVTIGTLATGDIHAFSRLQAVVAAGALELTWGTPTFANQIASQPG